MSARTRIILDVDTGTDDAVAIMMAALHPDIELLACTTVWGNLDVEHTTRNTLRVLDHIGAGADIPVHRGRNSPIVPIPPGARAAHRTITGYHPESLDLPEPTTAETPGDAPHRIVELVRSSPEPTTLVAVGSLTNIAAALVIDPGLTQNIAEMVIMGGANEFGNVTPAAEANIWQDPFSAEIVFRAGFERLVIVPLDATHQALITQDQADRLRVLGTPAAAAAAHFITQRIEVHDRDQPQPIPHSAAVHDALCIAYLVDPAVLGLHRMRVAAETTPGHSFGRTIMDVRGRSTEEPNASVALSADRERFFTLMSQTLAQTR